ncbi:MAG: class I SAM-dependent methyltransferase [Planctomycetes bacterium]|nr:class I SAM-dependent methyltransferase [Planctomycetota bacterium]
MNVHDPAFEPGLAPPPVEVMEWVPCYCCGSEARRDLVEAEDDLTGKPGRFRFVTCLDCGLAYQCPRVPPSHLPAYYDDQYVSHRRNADWGPLRPLFERAMTAHDRAKLALVRRHLALGPGHELLDVGSGSGSFLQHARRETGAHVTGVDWKDLRHQPWYEGVDLRVGLLVEQHLPPGRFDLVTMWHYLEHDTDPRGSLAVARDLLRPGVGRLVVEVPRLDSVTARLFGRRWPGLQAPQHTVLFTKDHLLRFVRDAGLEVVEHLPWGAFPPYFYLFTGAAFVLLRGRGLDLRRAIAPYFVGQALLAPLLLLERRLNLAMQTVVCRRPG